ncbi:hypothetical protein Hamer_G007391, partial [Homarus americanus]
VTLWAYEKLDSIRTISHKLGISATTEIKWIRRWNEWGNLNDLERHPRPRVTTPEEDARSAAGHES